MRAEIAGTGDGAEAGGDPITIALGAGLAGGGVGLDGVHLGRVGQLDEPGVAILGGAVAGEPEGSRDGGGGEQAEQTE